MLRACVLAGLLIACERRSTEQPPPVPRDAAIDAPVDAFVDQARIEALDRLYTYFATTGRKRSPVEAPDYMTHAYREWIFAYAYARAGKPERAKELVMTAKSRLESVEDDPVHRVLADAYAARVTNALAGKSSAAAPLPARVEAQLAMLDRVARYKVDRLREVSRVLNATEQVDAIGAFAKRMKDYRGHELESLRGVADADARGKLVSELVEQLATTEEERRLRFLIGIVSEAKVLPAASARRVLGQVTAQIELVASEERALAWATVIGLADMVDRARIHELVQKAAVSFTETDGDDLEQALVEIVRTIGKTHRAELGELWKRAEPRALDAKQSSRVRAAFAAGLVQLGDPRAKPMLAELEAPLDEVGGMTLHARLELVHALALAFAQLPREEALAAIERLARQYPGITDSYGTNSHYALSLLWLMDSVIVGVVDE